MPGCAHLTNSSSRHASQAPSPGSEGRPACPLQETCEILGPSCGGIPEDTPHGAEDLIRSLHPFSHCPSMKTLRSCCGRWGWKTDSYLEIGMCIHGKVLFSNTVGPRAQIGLLVTNAGPGHLSSSEPHSSQPSVGGRRLSVHSTASPTGFDSIRNGKMQI